MEPIKTLSGDWNCGSCSWIIYSSWNYCASCGEKIEWLEVKAQKAAAKEILRIMKEKKLFGY